MLYTLEVQITDGLMSEEFVRLNPVISRTIQIRGNQTLDHLHRAIFRAFERDDAHMYEFRFGDKYKLAPDKRYVMEESLSDPYWREEPAGVTSKTTIASLGLKEGGIFHYWFDFGDDWWHWIEVKAIEDRVPEGRLPKIIARIGDSPPQYIPQDEADW